LTGAGHEAVVVGALTAYGTRIDVRSERGD
jgi:hypothetical protein